MTTSGWQPGPAPLAGLRIVEVSSYVATPLCGLTLGQLGADVVRVEPLGGSPDRARWPLAETGSSLYWNGLNAGKKAIEVDLASARGRRLVADLVTSGGPAGGILVINTERWSDLSFESLAELRGDLIHVLLVGRDDGGTAVDYTVQAGTGFPSITGPRSVDGPVNHVLPAWDLAAGLYLATGLLAAVHHRTVTGSGSAVRVALEDVAMATAGQLGYLAEAQLRPEVERQRDGNFVYGTFGCDFTSADDVQFMVVALTPRQWRQLVTVTGIEDSVAALGRSLGADLSDEGVRYRHRAVLARLVADWFGRHDASAIRTLLASTRILWSEYRTFADLAAADARLLREHPLFDSVEQPGVGPLVAPGSPVVVDGRRTGPSAAPRIGQDSTTVLSERLDLTPAAVRDLVDSGVVGSGVVGSGVVGGPLERRP